MATRLSGKKKHTLDSDEEDDEDVPTFMKNEEIQGQEETTVDIEDGMRFTPFHMKDELEEGHFDECGMYIFKKSKDEIHDHWIEDVNWSEVKILEKTLKFKKEKEAEIEEPEEQIDELEILKQIITYISPKETVTEAIKRLGKQSRGTNPNNRRWKSKKVKSNENTEEQEQTSTRNITPEEMAKDQLTELIGCADKLLSTGFTSVYQATYERIVLRINQALEQSTSKNNTAIDADVDIFGSNETSSTVKKSDHADNSSKDSTANADDDDNVNWEFKWENKDEAESYGPYSSEQMLHWQEEGYFKEGVFVRKTSAVNRDFYNSNRIDFGLYL